MSASDSEREIFARIRGASRRSSPQQIVTELAALKSVQGAVLPESNLCEALQKNLQRNGASTAAVETRSEAVLEISQFIAHKHGQRRIVTGHDPRLAALPWRDGGLLPRFDVAQAGDSVSVSYAQCAIAETGSLALLLNRNNPALNNLLVEDHLILVDRCDIRAKLEDIWEQPGLKDPDSRSRGMIMISGPSSTADISMQLVLGAHGPRALHVIIVGTAPR
ncbi:LUD domain-containing protein [Congregibacter variabilis]|uniref:LUD domain-containing protein n=1 Tax=Congregibacter variabilis TaxID=3081200 RepID=A0ABZ0I6F5_9GAMM|nr:LUD domain-containing protein [Congregibacter sp. IMCC43200]